MINSSPVFLIEAQRQRKGAAALRPYQSSKHLDQKRTGDPAWIYRPQRNLIQQNYFELSNREEDRLYGPIVFIFKISVYQRSSASQYPPLDHPKDPDNYGCQTIAERLYLKQSSRLKIISSDRIDVL